MNLFGLSIITTQRLKELEQCEVKIHKFNQVYRWFAGWRDLDIIWEYLVNDINFGGIERARENYAIARNTTVYGEAKNDTSD